ncbi:hypothetical protein SOCEGT47_012690 [Sorangium cellulosum]|uniref:Secreted protein n=1 Tax=Sorangium cellulosum TaxID=56 RepID=A0A4P2PVH7_SORCE|nr:hypothetical protein [Sorangium cellulosum]AUX20795.1 hypothetical protein SOCEGT47_012690 [Sorangium cellulosum]
MHVSRWARAPSALQALIVAAVLPASALAAPAEPRAVDLRWEAPDGCPPADEVRSEIARLLGASEQHPPIEVEIAVARAGGARLRLDLRIRAPSPGERVIRGDDCASMSRAAALIVAMSIDPDAVARNAAAQPAAQPAPPPAVAAPVAGAPRPPPAAAVRPPAAAERDLEGALWLSAHIEQALVPAVGIGLAAGGGIRSGWLRADGAAGVVPSSSSRIAGMAAGAEFQLWFLEVDACARALERHLSVYVCALGRQHWLLARGREVDEAFARTAPIFAAGLGTLVERRFAGPLRVEGALHAVVPLRRPRFVVENLEGAVYRPPAAGLSARLGLALAF